MVGQDSIINRWLAHSRLLSIHLDTEEHST